MHEMLLTRVALFYYAYDGVNYCSDCPISVPCKISLRGKQALSPSALQEHKNQGLLATNTEALWTALEALVPLLCERRGRYETGMNTLADNKWSMAWSSMFRIFHLFVICTILLRSKTS